MSWACRRKGGRGLWKGSGGGKGECGERGGGGGETFGMWKGLVVVVVGIGVGIERENVSLLERGNLFNTLGESVSSGHASEVIGP